MPYLVKRMIPVTSTSDSQAANRTVLADSLHGPFAACEDPQRDVDHVRLSPGVAFQAGQPLIKFGIGRMQLVDCLANSSETVVQFIAKLMHFIAQIIKLFIELRFGFR